MGIGSFVPEPRIARIQFDRFRVVRRRLGKLTFSEIAVATKVPDLEQVRLFGKDRGIVRDRFVHLSAITVERPAVESNLHVIPKLIKAGDDLTIDFLYL